MMWIVGSGNHGYWLGHYARRASRLMQFLLRPGMTVFDAGANAGYFTLLFAKAVGPEGRVFSFEPEPENATYLRKHVSLNGFSNVTVIEAALAERNGTASFEGSGNQGRLSDIGQITVRTVTLDDFPTPDLVKMDIEGAEISALKGGKRIIEGRRTTWLVELHVRPGLIDPMFDGYAVQALDGQYGILARPKS